MFKSHHLIRNTVRISVTSDFNCPWCWVGKKNLDKAITSTPGVALQVTWQPYFLDPTLPPEGYDKLKHYDSKYGPKYRKTWERSMGRLNKFGVEVNLIEGSVLANTQNAHRLSHYVETRHGWEKQHAVQEVLFRRNHTEGPHRFPTVTSGNELSALLEEGPRTKHRFRCRFQQNSYMPPPLF